MLGFLLVPVLAAAVWAAASVLRSFAGHWFSFWPVLAGALGYAAFELLFSKPLGLYVFGHELTHALVAFFSGIRVKSFTAAPGGGEVVLSDTNVFVALAPYCLPLYTLIVVGVYQLVQFYAARPVHPLWFPLLIGFTLAFHASLTLHALLQRQPDLRYAGPFFSLAVILVANCIVLVLILKALFPAQVSLNYFWRQMGDNSLHFGAVAWHGIRWAFFQLFALAQSHGRPG